MTLGTLLKTLKMLPPSAKFEKGFCGASSYRGHYHNLGLFPAENVGVESMIKVLTDSNGTHFDGWKGGEFLMHEDVDCYLAYDGNTGPAIVGVAITSTYSEMKYDLVLRGEMNFLANTHMESV